MRRPYTSTAEFVEPTRGYHPGYDATYFPELVKGGGVLGMEYRAVGRINTQDLGMLIH
jgi:hypothetical protein